MVDIVQLKITGDVDSSKGLFTCRWGTPQVGEVTRLGRVTRLSI